MYLTSVTRLSGFLSNTKQFAARLFISGLSAECFSLTNTGPLYRRVKRRAAKSHGAEKAPKRRNAGGISQAMFPAPLIQSQVVWLTRNMAPEPLTRREKNTTTVVPVYRGGSEPLRHRQSMTMSAVGDGACDPHTTFVLNPFRAT